MLDATLWLFHPSLDEVMSRAEIERKVEDYLRNSRFSQVNSGVDTMA